MIGRIRLDDLLIKLLELNVNSLVKTTFPLSFFTNLVSFFISPVISFSKFLYSAFTINIWFDHFNGIYGSFIIINNNVIYYTYSD